jgi:hypothetical protein
MKHLSRLFRGEFYDAMRAVSGVNIRRLRTKSITVWANHSRRKILDSKFLKERK